MTTTRVYFSAWGYRVPELPAYAVRADHESASDAVYRSICRRAKLVVCGGPRSEGTTAEGLRHYYATLGTRAPGGGYTPGAEVWIAIEVRR